MKKWILGLLLMASPAFATTHPRLLSTRAQWADMISSSTIRPWSDLKASATTFYNSARGTTIRNPTTYTSQFGSGNANITQQQENLYAAAMGNLTLMYVLNTNSISSATYKNQIISLMNLWPNMVNDELNAPDITTGYNNAVPLNTAFMAMTIALDNIHDDLTAVQISSYEVVMDSWVAFSRTEPSSWALNNYGAYLAYEIYRDTSPFQVISDSTCYHVNMLGNSVIYPPAVCDTRQSYPGMSSEDSPSQLNSQGISGSGSGYAWARIGGAAREKMGKWGGVHVAAFTGVDPTYTTDNKMRNFYEWLFTAHTTPWNTKVVFADTANNQSIGEDEYIGLTSIYPGALYVVPNAYFAAGKYSTLAQQYANRSLAVSTITVVYPFEYIDYAVLSSTDVASHPVQSTVVQYGGAAFWDLDQSTGALMGVLNNSHLTKLDHFHASDFNGLFLAGYGETLLSNVGVGANTSTGILGFPWWFHHEDARSGNTLLIGNRNFAQDTNIPNHYSNSYWNWNPITPYVGNPDLVPLYGGDGITESVLSNGFDYACGLATSPYVFRSTTTGAVTATLGQNERNFMFVHPDTTTQVTNGYWMVSDEVHASSGGSVNQVWHPYGSSFSTKTLNAEYSWKVSSRTVESNTYLTIFFATPPTSILASSSPFSASPFNFVGTYMNSTYSTDASSNTRVLTILYPSNPTHFKSTFTRLSTGDATGASILSRNTTDYVYVSSGVTSLTDSGATFQGKVAFFRKFQGNVTQFFVRQGVAFSDNGTNRRGFTSDIPVSYHVNGTTGTITAPSTAAVSFFYPGLIGVQVDGVTTSGIDLTNGYTVNISSGSHDINYLLGSVETEATHVIKGTATFKGTVTIK